MIISVSGEDSIRPQLEAPEIAMLTLWHDLCRQELGASLEMAVADRKSHPATRDYSGELNTATLADLESRGPVLLVLLERSDDGTFDEVVMMHELGHWVLKLQGFTAIQHRTDPDTNVEIMLNSTAHHPPLHALQRALGRDPQAMIDDRARHNLTKLREHPQQQRRVNQVVDALLYADDLLSCSAELADEMRDALAARHRRVNRFVRDILEAADHYDMQTPDGNRRFTRRVVSNLRLGAGWEFVDEVETLRRFRGLRS